MIFLVAAVALLFTLTFVLAANPVNPDDIVNTANLSKDAATQKMVNISGGVISKMNVTATIQNPRWKAFVGEVIGEFTLEDNSGNRIYDWQLASVSGRIYSSRATQGAIDWSKIKCAATADLETENTALNHKSSNDNITATFKDSSHGLFLAAGKEIASNECTHTVNTYVGNAATAAFEEVAMTDEANMIYAALLEEDVVGFDGSSYDFQMIVPEDDTTGANTLYYMYVELD